MIPLAKLPSYWTLLTQPRATFDRLLAGPARREAVAMALITASGWTLLLLLLAFGGHEPSGPIALPIPRGDYYLAQAFFYWPVFALQLFIAATVAHRAGRWWGGEGSYAGVAVVMTFALSVPSLFAWCVPDLVVYLGWGFDSLAAAMRYYVPLCGLWTLLLCTLGLQRAHRVPWPKAFVVAFFAYAAQLIAGAPFIR